MNAVRGARLGLTLLSPLVLLSACGATTGAQRAGSRTQLFTAHDSRIDAEDEVDAPYRAPDAGEPGVSYRFLGSFLSDRLMLDEQTIQPAVEQRLITFESGIEEGSCPGDESQGIGVADLPSKVPLELAAWLALANLHVQERGAVRASVKLSDRGSESSGVSVSRDVTEFSPEAGIACRYQTKAFRTQVEAASEHTTRGDGAVPEWKKLEDLGLRWRRGGDFVWELTYDDQEDGRVFQLRVLLTDEAEARQGDGQWMCETLSCSSRSPLLMDGLATYEVGESQTGANERRTCVWRNNRGGSQ